MATNQTIAESVRAFRWALPGGRPGVCPSPAASAVRPRGVSAPVRWRSGTLLVVGLVLVTVLGEWPLLHGRVVAGLDSLTQFYPWYALVGSALRDGRLPGWNPYSMAGGPLAGNPLSGWTYLPAMFALTLFPLPTAAVIYQLFHVLLATLATYALARILGLRRAGAALAAVAYGQGGLITAESACCFAFASVGAWLPVLLLGGALAIRAQVWPGRFRGWSLAALALSQIVASWLGQGSYYALLAFGSFVAFQVVTRPSDADPRRRVGWRGWIWSAGWPLVLHLVVPSLFGIGLAAAGLLPRIELNLLSSLAGGYAAEDQQVGGWTIWEWGQFVQPGYWYAGIIVVALALAGLWLARRARLVWYLVILGATILVFALPTSPLLLAVYRMLPGFSSVHLHLPDRIVTVFMLVPALLAGLALDAIVQRHPRRPVIALLVIGLVFADQRVAREWMIAGYASAGSVHQLDSVDLAAYYAPTPTASFLQERLRLEGPFRFLGYGPDPAGLAYTQRFSDPSVLRLGVNNRGVTDRLFDVQGYDAVHLARFDAFLRAANGRDQNYHNADIFAPGLRSPLLDLLAVRYVVTPSGASAHADGSPLAEPAFTTAFDDGDVQILRDADAQPWAWVVHDAQAATAAEALAALGTGRVDPRRTVLLEPSLASPLAPDALFHRVTRGAEAESLEDMLPVPTPARDGSTGGGADRVAVVAHDPERIVVQASTAEDGILVLSEVAYPGWQATIDGAPTPVFVADGLLRAVALPAGDHLVEFRFESAALRIGVTVTLLTATILSACCALPLVRLRPRTGVS